MTLLITIFAAVIATAVWYKKAPDNTMHLGILCWMYWGAALMWMADAIFEYRELGAEYFAPALEDMINDSFLGFSVVALGLVIWIVCVHVKVSKGIIRTALQKR